MKGQHDITVRIPGAVYKIHVRRNITVLRGNSGTGKSTLVKAIYDINNTKLAGQNQTEAVIECNVPVRAIMGNDFEYASFQLSKIQNSIVFIDEDQQWIQSEDFARIVKGSQNYWVLVQRDRLGRLRNKPWISIDTGVLHNCTDSEIKQTLNTFISDINI